MRCVAIALLLGASLAGPPRPAPVDRAVPKPPTVEQAADAVLAAVRAKDDAALKALAAKDEPDPWLVADELLRRGEADAAEAFAKGASRVDTDALPGYVASQPDGPGDPGRRERLANASAALVSKAPDRTLEALGPGESPVSADVVGLRLASDVVMRSRLSDAPWTPRRRSSRRPSRPRGSGGTPGRPRRITAPGFRPNSDLRVALGAFERGRDVRTLREEDRGRARAERHRRHPLRAKGLPEGARHFRARARGDGVTGRQTGEGPDAREPRHRPRSAGRPGGGALLPRAGVGGA